MWPRLSQRPFDRQQRMPLFFGPQARGEADEFSDVDLFVKLDGAVDEGRPVNWNRI